jgi:murein DD-endopeptidase MepM/ murein hydrolase activator NlpD
MRSPVEKPVVTSHYGWRLLNGQKQWHTGIDYVSGAGNKTVSAIANGTVVLDFDDYVDAKRWTDPASSAGNYICVKHDLAQGSFFVRYLHLKKNTVTHGQKVLEGQILGDYADVGFSYGSHLHIEAYDSQWKPFDISELLKGVVPV